MSKPREVLLEKVRKYRKEREMLESLKKIGPLSVEMGPKNKVFIVSNITDTTFAEMTDDDDDMVQAAHLFATSFELFEALESLSQAVQELRQGKRGGATMGRISQADDLAKTILAKAKGGLNE